MDISEDSENSSLVFFNSSEQGRQIYQGISFMEVKLEQQLIILIII